MMKACEWLCYVRICGFLCGTCEPIFLIRVSALVGPSVSDFAVGCSSALELALAAAEDGLSVYHHLADVWGFVVARSSSCTGCLTILSGAGFVAFKSGFF